MKKIHILSLLLTILLVSCNSKPSLQKYFVEKTEDKNFVSVDLAANMLNLDKSKVTVEQAEALKSFDKVNILAFKSDATNMALYDTEKAKVKEILKDEKYQELMKFGSGKAGASLSFVGDEDHIDEFVLFANQKENGFAVVRVLGKDMNPTGIVTMLTALEHANLDMKQLEPLKMLAK